MTIKNDRFQSCKCHRCLWSKNIFFSQSTIEKIWSSRDIDRSIGQQQMKKKRRNVVMFLKLEIFLLRLRNCLFCLSLSRNWFCFEREERMKKREEKKEKKEKEEKRKEREKEKERKWKREKEQSIYLTTRRSSSLKRCQGCCRSVGIFNFSPLKKSECRLIHCCLPKYFLKEALVSITWLLLLCFCCFSRQLHSKIIDVCFLFGSLLFSFSSSFLLSSSSSLFFLFLLLLLDRLLLSVRLSIVSVKIMSGRAGKKKSRVVEEKKKRTPKIFRPIWFCLEIRDRHVLCLLKKYSLFLTKFVKKDIFCKKRKKKNIYLK